MKKGKVGKGLHILADLYNCQEPQILASKIKLEKTILKIIQKARFNALSSLFYKFPDGGITGLVLLSESHLAIHTWPEKSYASLDIFLCNYSSDNSHKVRKAFELFQILLKPAKMKKRELRRE